MSEEHDCAFGEEQEPSGRRILGPCLICGRTALDALQEIRWMVDEAMDQRDAARQETRQAIARAEAAEAKLASRHEAIGYAQRVMAEAGYDDAAPIEALARSAVKVLKERDELVAKLRAVESPTFVSPIDFKVYSAGLTTEILLAFAQRDDAIVKLRKERDELAAAVRRLVSATYSSDPGALAQALGDLVVRRVCGEASHDHARPHPRPTT